MLNDPRWIREGKLGGFYQQYWKVGMEVSVVCMSFVLLQRQHSESDI